jgi:hypothetical protein
MNEETTALTGVVMPPEDQEEPPPREVFLTCSDQFMREVPGSDGEPYEQLHYYMVCIRADGEFLGGLAVTHPDLAAERIMSGYEWPYDLITDITYTKNLPVEVKRLHEGKRGSGGGF